MCVYFLIEFSCSYFAFSSCFCFFNDTATTEIYTLSLHDALPISYSVSSPTAYVTLPSSAYINGLTTINETASGVNGGLRSEEHTSELQSLRHLVCRLLLEKKKKTKRVNT